MRRGLVDSSPMNLNNTDILAAAPMVPIGNVTFDDVLTIGGVRPAEVSDFELVTETAIALTISPEARTVGLGPRPGGFMSEQESQMVRDRIHTIQESNYARLVLSSQHNQDEASELGLSAQEASDVEALVARLLDGVKNWDREAAMERAKQERFAKWTFEG